MGGCDNDQKIIRLVMSGCAGWLSPVVVVVRGCCFSCFLLFNRQLAAGRTIIELV